MLAFGDQRDQSFDIESVRAKGIGRDLAVEDLGGDVGIIGRQLPPTLPAPVGGDADKADIAVREGLQALDFHGIADGSGLRLRGFA